MRKRLFQWIAVFGLVSLAGWFASAKSEAIPQNGTEPPPATFNAVPNGTHFLVGLDDEVNTGKDKVNRKFDVKTLEPLESTNGSVIPPGTRIRGHISRIEPAGTTGRARIWLTFDEIDTNHRRLPLVAFVSSVPGEFSVKPGESKEGEIEARTSKGTRDLEAAAGGAAIGATAGPRTPAKEQLRGLRWVVSRDFWCPQASARSWICRKARSSIWFWIARCI